jgi:hypothetical protein
MSKKIYFPYILKRHVSTQLHDIPYPGRKKTKMLHQNKENNQLHNKSHRVKTLLKNC